MYKKYIILLLSLFVSTNALALTSINYSTQTRWGTEAYKVHNNFVELDSYKSTKSDTVMKWSAWPSGTTFTTSSPGVWYNGKLYKCIATYVKGSSGTPETLTTYFTEVTSGTTSTVTADNVSLTPLGNISANNVQAGLYELDNDKLDKDSDLLSIAALTTTSFGRSLLTENSSSTLMSTISAQPTLVSGTNIKTINGVSLLGSGDMLITSGDGGIAAPLTNGVVTYNGGGVFGTSLTVGTAANNLVQLNGSAALPAISGLNLTTLPDWVVTESELTSAIGSINNYFPAGTVTGDTAIWNNTSQTWEAGSFAINLATISDLQINNTNLIDDTATNGATGKLWSVDKTYDELATKQSTLVSGTNIKTINGVTLLGSGNMTISGAGGAIVDNLASVPYSDVACTNSGYYNGYVYYCVNGYFTQKSASSLHSNPSSSYPTIGNSTIASNGTSLSMVGSENLAVGAGGSGGFDLDCSTSGTNIPLTFVSVSGTNLTYTIGSTVYQGDTCNIDYTQPGNGIEAATGGADLQSFADKVVTTNSSTQVVSGINDSFATDTSSNYTVIYSDVAGPAWDGTYYRFRGESNSYWSTAVYHNTSLGTANHQNTAKVIVGSGSQSQLMFRVNGAGSSSTGWVVTPSTSGAYLYTFSGSTHTYVATINYTGGKTWADTNVSHLMKVGVNGTTLSLYIDWNDDGDFLDTDETVTTSQTIASTPTGNYIGLEWIQNGANVWVDDLSAGTF